MSDVIMQYKTMLDTSGFASGAQRMNSQLGEMGIRTNAASSSLGPLGNIMGTVAKGPMAAVVAASIAVGGALFASVQAAAAWETSMSGIAKTSGLSGAALEGMSQKLLTMSTEMPITAKELADIAVAGGSLGIGQAFAEKGDFEGQANAMAEFSEVASKMGIGFGMAADQAATAGAKILNSFGESMNSSNLEKLGSVVNTMGDSFAATEPQVLDFLNRASFLNTTMGQSIPQVAALGTTLISAGLDSETAATGIKSMLNMLTSETSKKGGLDNWAKLMGVSVDELKSKVATDLNGTLMETAGKIAAIVDPTERFQAAVAAAGSEGAPALLKLVGQQENYNKALGMSNEQWAKATSLQKTYEAQSGTMNSQWTMFTNTITMAATQLGTVMLPALSSALAVMTELAKAGMDVGESLSKATGIGQEGGTSAKLHDLTGGLMGMSVDEQAAFAAQQEKERLAEAMGTEQGRIEETAKNEAAEQVRRGEESAKLAEAAELGEKEGKAKAKAFWDATKEYTDKYGAGIEAGYSSAEQNWMSQDTAGYNYIKAQAKLNEIADDMPYAILRVPYVASFEHAKQTADRLDFDIFGNKSYNEDKGDTQFAETSLAVKELDDGTRIASGSIEDLFTKFRTGFKMTEPQAAAALQNIMETGTQINSETEQLRNLYATDYAGWKQRHSDLVKGKEEIDAILTAYTQQEKVAYEEGLFAAWVNSLKIEMQGAGRSLGKELWMSMTASIGEGTEDNKSAQAVWDNILSGLANADWSDLGGYLDELNQYVSDKILKPEDAKATGKLYIETLLTQITEVAPFLEDKATEIGDQLSKSLEDHLIGTDDQKLYRDLIPQLEVIKKEYPEAFKEAGMEAELAFAKYATSGASSSMILAEAKRLGLLAGEGYKDALTGVFGKEIKEVTMEAQDMLQAIASGKVWDVGKFGKNMFQPEMLKESEAELKNLNTGTIEGTKAAYDYAASLAEATIEQTALFDDRQIRAAIDFRNGLIGIDTYLGIMSTEADKAKKSLTSFKQATDDMGLSEFGQWQEGDTSGVFREGYIGASTGTGYEAYLKQKAADATIMGEDERKRRDAAYGGNYMSPDYYGIVKADVKDVTININDTEAMAKLSLMDTTTSHLSGLLNPLKVMANTTSAQAEIDRFVKSVNALAPVVHATAQVNVDAYQIQVAAEAAISRALQNVRIK